MNNVINYGSQKIDNNDIKSVVNSLKNKLLTTGPITNLFENELKKKLKVNYAHVCNSGTSALYLALKSIGIKKGDVVISPAINFIASVNIASLLGAKVYLSDVDPLTSQSSPDQIKDCINKNKIKKIKALIIMFNGGYPRNIYEYYKLKKKYSFYLIEDACHAFGASYIVNKKKYFIGSCKHSDISTFSFHPLKTITTCEGGAITTNNSKISRKIQLLRSHGIKRNSKYYWKYDAIENGLNLRLSDVNCSLGISQLKKIESIIRFREKIYSQYIYRLDNYQNVIKIIRQEKKTHPSYHLVIALLNFKKLKISRDKFMTIMNKHKIFLQIHYKPIYKFKIFNNFKSLEGSENYYNSCISLPIHLNIKSNDILRTIKIIKKTIDQWKKN